MSLQRAGAIRELRLCNDPPKQTYRLDVYGTPEVTELLDYVEIIAQVLPLSAAIAADITRLCRAVRSSKTRLASYTPDYTYRESPDWRFVVEDWKPQPPPGWSKTAALMRVCHGIDVRLTGGKRRA